MAWRPLLIALLACLLPAGGGPGLNVARAESKAAAKAKAGARAAKPKAGAKAAKPKAGAKATKPKAGAKAAKPKAGARKARKASDLVSDLDTVHRVRKGDSPWSIARKHKVTVADLRRLNGEKKLRMLHPGQVVIVKKGDPRRADEVRPFLKDWGRLEPGPGYVIKRPDKNYGRPWAIELIRRSIADLHERYPESSDVFVGDLSGPIGGRILHHLSHKTGRDVDFAYFLKDNQTLSDFVEVTPETVDVEKSWQLIESCLRTDSVEFVFMDHGLQPLFHAHAEALGFPAEDLGRLFQYPRDARTREGIIRHVKGHADHLHVRFRCPADDRLCK